MLIPPLLPHLRHWLPLLAVFAALSSSTLSCSLQPGFDVSTSEANEAVTAAGGGPGPGPSGGGSMDPTSGGGNPDADDPSVTESGGSTSDGPDEPLYPDVGRSASLGKLEPPDGKTVLLIGQNSPPMVEYVEQVGMPAGFLTYSSIQWNEAFSTHPDDVSDGLKEFYPWTNGYDHIVMQIGLYFRDIGAQAVSQGNYDSQLTALGNHLKAGGVPVFLRVGYEVNVGHPDSNAYVAAFKHIVTHLDGMSVDNVAYVWHPHDTVGGAIDAYYPGDHWVDWIAVSMLPNVEVTSFILDYGKSKGKPLMIAESTPAGFGTTDPNAFSGWFSLVSSAIHNWDIKAFCYINQNWAIHGDEGQTGWGDTRVQSNPTSLSIWKAEIEQSRYLKNGALTWASLGYTP